MTTTTKGHAQRSYKANRLRQIAYGRWKPYTDATPVRDHVTAVMAYGITYDGIARLSGVARDTVKQIVEGTRGRQPSTRVKVATADALMAVRFDLDAFPDTFMISGAGTNRRVQALAALGYTLTYQAERLGRTLQEVHDLVSTPRVTAAMARRVRDLYADLSMRLPVDVPRTNYARTYATKHGWLPPLAWDDDLIDLPDEALAAELRRRVAGRDMAELARCYRYVKRHGERSPLVVAGAEEYKRRRRASRRVA